MRYAAALFACALLFATPIAHAQEQPGQSVGGLGVAPSEQVANPRVGPLFSPPLGSEQHLFGDWGGARTWLAQRGVDVLLEYLGETAGNVTGGERRGVDYAGQVGLEVDLDFGKLAALPGFALHGVVVEGHGRSLSLDTLRDDLDAVQEIYGDRGAVLAHLVYLYAEQVTADKRLDIAAGWLPVGTYFAASPLYCDFMNVIFCGNPHPLPVYPGEPDWPNATWGGLARIVPVPDFYLMAGLFEVNPRFGGRSGWNLSLAGSTGVSLPVEIGYVPHLEPHDLIGHYKFGFDEDTSTYPDLFADAAGEPLALSGRPVAPHHGRRMYYVLLDQMLARTGKSDTDGVVLFGGWVHADAPVSPLENHYFAGFASTAAALGRPKDTFGFAWNWFAVARGLTRTQELQAALGLPLTDGGLGQPQGIQTHEQTLELMYTAQVWRGVSLMPDIQYVIRPGGTTTVRDALVLALRTTVAF